MIKRTRYIERLLEFKDSPVVKIITGLRRSGKSSILLSFIEELKKNGIQERNIIFFDFESLKFAAFRNYMSLYNEIISMAKNCDARQKIYIFLDELQNVDGWEKAVASLMKDLDSDIYITGSNSRLLSGEFATHLAGRYVETRIFPLTFSEFKEFHKATNEETKSNKELFLDYMRFGGLPGIHFMHKNENLIRQYLADVYNSVILKDVIERNGIKSAEKLESTMHFLLENIGNIFSAKSIAAFVKSQFRTFGNDAVYEFLNALQNAFIINKVSRYDLKGKQVLETFEKYYVADLGIRNAVTGFRQNDIGAFLENIVLMELLSRGFKVFIGKKDAFEIDFIAEKNESRTYIQVSYLLTDIATTEREFRPLREIGDNYEKIVLTLDDTPDFNDNGIQKRNLLDWLLS